MVWNRKLLCQSLSWNLHNWLELSWAFAPHVVENNFSWKKKIIEILVRNLTTYSLKHCKMPAAYPSESFRNVKMHHTEISDKLLNTCMLYIFMILFETVASCSLVLWKDPKWNLSVMPLKIFFRNFFIRIISDLISLVSLFYFFSLSNDRRCLAETLDILTSH